MSEDTYEFQPAPIVVLPYAWEVYVPVSRARPEHKRRIIDNCGGLTVLSGLGEWRAPDGAVVTEPVYIYRWFSESFAPGRQALMDVVNYLLAAGEQAVMYTQNGTTYMRSAG